MKVPASRTIRARRQSFGGRAVMVVLLAAALLAACGAGSASPRPGASVAPSDGATLRPATTPSSRPATVAPSTPDATASWPDGWDAQFCDAFAEIVVAQELAVDIGRALDEDARDDALALARELERTAQGAGERLGDLPEWEPAGDLMPRLVRMMEIGDAMGRFYGRHIELGREAALERVGELITEMRPLVGDALAELAEIEEQQGLRCPEHEFVLESP